MIAKENVTLLGVVVVSATRADRRPMLGGVLLWRGSKPCAHQGAGGILSVHVSVAVNESVGSPEPDTTYVIISHNHLLRSNAFGTS